jgi:hypothetical protein
MAPFIKYTDSAKRAGGGETRYLKYINAEYIISAYYEEENQLLNLTVDSPTEKTVQLHGQDADDALAVLQKL